MNGWREWDRCPPGPALREADPEIARLIEREVPTGDPEAPRETPSKDKGQTKLRRVTSKRLMFTM